LGVTENKLKDFQNNDITALTKVQGTPTRVASTGTTFGTVLYSGLTSAQLLPASANALALDDRFNMFISKAIANWNVATTWDALAVPGAGDDVEIAGAYAVTIPADYAALANSVTIDEPAGPVTTGGLTLANGSAGTTSLTITSAGALVNNNSKGAGLTVGTSASVSITNADLTNAGKIVNNGTITVN
jgi:hypothetical protein